MKFSITTYTSHSKINIARHAKQRLSRSKMYSPHKKYVTAGRRELVSWPIRAAVAWLGGRDAVGEDGDREPSSVASRRRRAGSVCKGTLLNTPYNTPFNTPVNTPFNIQASTYMASVIQACHVNPLSLVGACHVNPVYFGVTK